MPFWFRATTRYTRAGARSPSSCRPGERLRAVLLTHAHWDHTSGLPELAGVPIWVTHEEKQYVETGGYLTVVARLAQGYEEYGSRAGRISASTRATTSTATARSSWCPRRGTRRAR